MSAEKIKLEAILACLNSLVGVQTYTDHRITVHQTEENQKQLEALGIEFFDAPDGGLEINTNQDECYIRHSKPDFLATCHDQYDWKKKVFRKPVIIMQGGIIYSADIAESELPLFYRNLLSSFEMESLFREKIADHTDLEKQEFILLSSETGRESFSYRSRKEAGDKFLDFLETGNLHEMAKSLKDKAADSSFVGFFKAAFIDKSEKNFFKALTTIAQVCHVAQRNFNLYQTNFDFEKFEEKFLDAKRKYFEKYFDFHSTILSKTTNFPIQYGIYIFLLMRFAEEFWMLVATVLLILSSAALSLANTSLLKKELKGFKKDFDSTVKRLKKKLKAEDIGDEPEEFSKKLAKHNRMINCFQYFTLISNAAFLIMAVVLLANLPCEQCEYSKFLYGEFCAIKGWLSGLFKS